MSLNNMEPVFNAHHYSFENFNWSEIKFKKKNSFKGTTATFTSRKSNQQGETHCDPNIHKVELIFCPHGTDPRTEVFEKEVTINILLLDCRKVHFEVHTPLSVPT